VKEVIVVNGKREAVRKLKLNADEERNEGEV